MYEKLQSCTNRRNYYLVHKKFIKLILFRFAFQSLTKLQKVYITEYKNRVNWQIIGLSVIYLLTSLLLIFFMPNTIKGPSNSTVKKDYNNQLTAHPFKTIVNAPKRLDKIIEARKRFSAYTGFIILLFTAVPSARCILCAESFIGIKTPFNHPQTIRAGAFNCCWRL